MLNVILGETLEHKRFFEQALAGRTDLLGRRADGAGTGGGVLPHAGWIEQYVPTAAPPGCRSRSAATWATATPRSPSPSSGSPRILSDLSVSALIETEPEGPGVSSDQPLYLNAVVIGETDLLGARALLDALLADRARLRPRAALSRRRRARSIST